MKSFITSELPRLMGFVLVGGGGFIVHAGTVFLLTERSDMNKVLAWFPAFVLAVTFTWLMNRLISFRGLKQHSARKEAARYLTVQSIGASLNFAIYASLIALAVPYLSYPILALACGAGTAFFFNYIALRIFVFGKAPDMGTAPDSLDESDVDDIYYEHAMSVPLARKLTVYARTKMFEHFMRVMTPGPDTRILDFGASETENDEANMLEKSYPWISQITCAGLGDGEQIRAAYPDLDYLSIKAGAPLPFEDNSFDIAYSNAVFEHVGSREARNFLLGELQRVAKRVYVTTPNRWFPVEHHTAIPLLHYSPKAFRSATKNGKFSHWSMPQNVQFLSLRDLKRVFRNSNIDPKGAHTGVWIGPFSSNITCWS